MGVVETEKQPISTNWSKQKLVKYIQDEKKFISELFDIVAMPSHEEEEEQDDLVFVGKPKVSREEARKTQRAKSFQELQERYQKLKGTKDFSIKNKLMKKSLSRRIKKKNRKEERLQKKKLARTKHKAEAKQTSTTETVEERVEKPVVKSAPKPVFNSQGKLVFSKFDFSESGVPEEKTKGERDPKKILETWKKHKETVKELKAAGDTEKASKLMEKVAWKNALAKAEGQKVKDDPLLLKKSIKKKEQKKKQSATKWEQRLQKVEKGKEDRQKKRESNLMKRKKDKKKKVIKKAVKKGRMVE